MNTLEKLKDKQFLENLRKGGISSENGFRKEYIAKDRILKVENDEKAIELKLISSLHLMVKAGKCVKIAELEIIGHRGKTNLFNDVNFIDKRKYKDLNKEFVYKYAPIKTVKIELSELTELPEDKRFIEKEIGDWENAVEFEKLQDLPKEKVRIGVFTNTILNEKVEWVPNIEGLEILEWADYDVTEIDELEHDTIYGLYNSLVLIDSTHFILAYQGEDGDGFIKTFSIDGSYDNITEIDVLQHDTSDGIYNSLVKIDSTHFALAYRGTGYNGYIKTFSIDGSYDNITEIDSLAHDINEATHNSLVLIDSTHLALAYTGLGNDGFIKTFSIDGSYDNITEIDSLEQDTADATYNSFVKIDATHFALAYESTSLKGYIKTFSIDGSYDNITEIDSLEQDTTIGRYNSLVLIDSTHLALAYYGAGWGTLIKTFSIDSNQDNITEIDVFDVDTNDGYFNSLVLIDSTHLALAYAGSGSDGYIDIFSFDGSYDNIALASSSEHDIVQGTHNSLVLIDSTHLALAYAGSGSDGYIKTFSIEEPTPTGTNFQINIGDSWKEVPAMKINIGDSWKEVVAVKQNIGDSWKDVF